MSVCNVMAHTRDLPTRKAPIIYPPIDVVADVLASVTKLSEVDSKWRWSDKMADLDAYPTILEKVDVIISNPPYNKRLDDGHNLSRYWLKVLPLAVAHLNEGGIFALLAPHYPGCVYKDFELVEAHTDKRIEFPDTNISATWVVLRKKTGSRCPIPFPKNDTQFPNLTCRYLDPDVRKDVAWYHSSSPRIHFNYHGGGLCDPNTKGNGVSLFIYGAQADLDEFMTWYLSSSGQKFWDSVVGLDRKGKMVTTKLREMLGMKK